MNNYFRSHNCGILRSKHDQQEVQLSGWVHSIRDHGGVVFIMLRDQYGLTQIVSSSEIDPTAFKIIQTIRNEFVLQIKGNVRKRTKETINTKISTGEIEVIIQEVKILNESQPLPFEIDQNTLVKDDAIRYRYLHLRRPEIKDFILKRYQVTKLVRDFFHEEGFVEIETPLLTTTSPEGARDFLVPSRTYPGEFYALPQSPQQYKQLLMVAGFDRYFQIARALRDEDSRADRQPEHTQIDFEMSFVTRDDILCHLEKMFIKVVTTLFPHKKLMAEPFPRLNFNESMMKYGSDKPDLRFGLEIEEISSIFEKTEFKIFSSIIKRKGKIKAIRIPQKSDLSRKQLDDLIVMATDCGLKGLVWVVYDETPRSSAGKVITDDELEQIKNWVQAEKGDVVILAGDQESVVLSSLGEMRVRLARNYNLIDDNLMGFAFVIDFPLMQWDEEKKLYDPLHHMFVKPREEDLPLLDSDPGKVLGTQFDAICNGYELCSGSERIHTSKLQRKVMRLIGLEDEEIDFKFGHMLKAFDFGAPPHGGAAPGLDRLIMVLTNTTNIRDVIAFPKTQKGQDLMMNSPSMAGTQQLKDLALKIDFDALKEERVEYLQSIHGFSERTF